MPRKSQHPSVIYVETALSEMSFVNSSIQLKCINPQNNLPLCNVFLSSFGP